MAKKSTVKSKSKTKSTAKSAPKKSKPAAKRPAAAGGKRASSAKYEQPGAPWWKSLLRE